MFEPSLVRLMKLHCGASTKQNNQFTYGFPFFTVNTMLSLEETEHFATFSFECTVVSFFFALLSLSTLQEREFFLCSDRKGFFFFQIATYLAGTEEKLLLDKENFLTVLFSYLGHDQVKSKSHLPKISPFLAYSVTRQSIFLVSMTCTKTKNIFNTQAELKNANKV